jgi:hypothetical protein
LLLKKQPIFKDNRGLFTPIKLNDNWTQSNVIVNNRWQNVVQGLGE